MSGSVDGKDIYLAGGYPGTPTGDATQDVWKYNGREDLDRRLRCRRRGSGALLDRELHLSAGYQTADKGDHCSAARWRTQWQGATRYPTTQSSGGCCTRRKDLHRRSAVLMTTWSPKTRGCGIQPNQTPGRQRGSAEGSVAYFSNLVINNRIIVAGGEIDHQSSVSDVTAYDPLSIPGQH